MHGEFGNLDLGLSVLAGIPKAYGVTSPDGLSGRRAPRHS